MLLAVLRKNLKTYPTRRAGPSAVPVWVKGLEEQTLRPSTVLLYLQPVALALGLASTWNCSPKIQVATVVRARIERIGLIIVV
jgi:hypothetical protein